MELTGLDMLLAQVGAYRRRHDHHETPADAKTVVEIFVDPMCPFAWLTSRWLVEVERLGRIELTIRVMSLSILNEGRDDVSDFYRDLVDRAWATARIAIAIERDHGHDALRAWYDELGLRIHVGGEPVDDDVISETLAAVGLPTTLLAEAAPTSRPTSTIASERATGARSNRSATTWAPPWSTSSATIARSPSSDRS